VQAEAFSGAEHTRYQHSLGVAHLSQKLVEHANMSMDAHALGDWSPDLFMATATEKCQVVLAGLCHDLGHGPFSHLFEKWLQKLDIKWCACIFHAVLPFVMECDSFNNKLKLLFFSF
jgi:HD superfamily phosphohydrolase